MTVTRVIIAKNFQSLGIGDRHINVLNRVEQISHDKGRQRLPWKYNWKGLAHSVGSQDGRKGKAS